MPSSSRPKTSCGTPRPPTATPMSERQQLALVLQLTSQTNPPVTSHVGQSTSRSRDRNERGETPLHIASIRGDHEKVKKLLDHGADPNIADFAGWTPLHEACFNGWLEIAAMLIDVGANVNARGYDNDTPLHDAAISGKVNLVKYLLSCGADPFCKNKNGKLPFDVARPPAHNYLACITESATSHRVPQTGRSRDDNKKVGEETSAAGCGTTIMETLSKSTVDKNECKDTLVANDKTVASAVVVKNNEGEASSNSTSGLVSSSQEESNSSVQKRNFTETTDSTDPDNFEDDATKRKKRKEPEPVKETTKSAQQSRVNVGRGSISGNKPPGPASKTGVAPLSKGGGPLLNSGTKSNTGNSNPKTSVGSHGLSGQAKGAGNASSAQGKGGAQGSQSGKSGSGQGKSQGATLSIAQVSVKGVPDKKSPCASPKPSAFVKDNEPDAEETKVDSSGPKVPPLKIVIPGGVGGAGNSGGQQEGEGGSTQRGGAKNRGGSATLPYIIHFNINAAGETVPVDGNESWTDGKDDKRQSSSDDKNSGSAQRVLRSHRNTDGDRDKERGRSSPHVSATPCSPIGAPVPTKTPPPYHSSRQSPDTNDSGTDASNVTSGNNSGGGSSSSSGGSSGASASTSQQPSVELHPRKRKLKASKESHAHQSAQAADSGSGGSAESHSSSHSPQNNPYQMYLNIKKQIERRQKGLFPVQPKPPQGFKDYLMIRCTYVLKTSNKQQPIVNPPPSLPPQMREEFIGQENDRHSLRVQHLVEKEKLVLAVEQEILRVHGRAARALANQALPFSVCTLLKDKEVYNMLTPEQEEKERNAQRSRYNGRLFLSWLQDVDDKWEKIKEGMVRRHHTEAESLHATQTMSWEWKLKELGLCDHKSTPFIDQSHVPMVHVSDDFDLLPA